MSLETEILKALDMTRGWKIRDGELLLLDGGEVLARFAERNAREIAGTAWRWVQTLHNDDRKTAPADPEKYTVRFREDGTLQVRADCNQKGGTYSSDGKLLSIEITHSTRITSYNVCYTKLLRAATGSSVVTGWRGLH